MKIAILLLSITLLQLASCGVLVENPFARVPGPVFIAKDCSVEVDYHIREKYWYYLPDAQLYYVAHIKLRGGFYFIHQYRNYIGTFMAISKYHTPYRKIDVVTFVRLGDGV